MNFVLNIINSKKTQIFIGIISVILLIIIILNSIYPQKIEFNNYYMIITHIIALYGFIQIINLIYNENGNQFKYIFLDSRIFFLIALLFLFYTPFYLILENKKIAEELSIYAYYFLVIGVIYEIVLSKFEKKINSIKQIAINNKTNTEKKKDRLEKLALKKLEKKINKKR